jgi:hypothetical protein
MIFTIGNTDSYLKALADDPDLKKIGRRDEPLLPDFPDGYPGGTVWQTREDAQSYIDVAMQQEMPEWDPARFSVFGLEAEWENDTYTPEDGKQSLLRDAKIIKLD